MAFIDPSTPNLTDFTTFVYAQGVPTGDLPSDSPYLQWSYNIALPETIVNPCGIPPILYVLAVYNLGMHTLIKIAQDQSGNTFFADSRKFYKLLTFVAGPVVASADESTSNTLLAPDFLKHMTMAGLDLLKTPWGQSYLAYSQAYGPNVTGVS